MRLTPCRHAAAGVVCVLGGWVSEWRYTLITTATNAAGQRDTAKLAFTIGKG